MKTITVKSIPDDLYERLRQSATENRRSINSEIIVCIERSVQSRKQEDIDTILAKARQMRSWTKANPITNEELTEMKIAGRR